MYHPSKSIRVVTAAARQRGYSVLEIGLSIAIIAAIAVIAFLAVGDTQSSISQTRALGEISAVASSARQHRSSFAQGGLYTGINMAELEGYNLAGMDVTGAAAASRGINAYGLDMNIAASGTSPTNGDATITYETPTQEECEALMALFTDDPGTTATTATDEHAPGFKAGSVCTAAGELTLVLE